MKKQITTAALILSLSFCFNPSDANAGFVGPEAKNSITVKEIMQNHYDDMKVDVKGYLIKRLSHDKYLFKDGTGEIIVDIDEKYMPNTNITPKTLVRIYGEIDVKYKFNKIEIDAHRIEVVKQ